MKVVILNDEGHQEMMVEDQVKLDEIKEKNKDKWFFISDSGQKVAVNEVSLDHGIRELQIIEPLVGG